MSITQNECFVELSSFDDLARYACAFQEYPKRVYSQELDGLRIVSSSLTLANTLLIFYAQMTKSGRYISYQVTAGKEICDIVESTKNISHYAPIVHMDSEISPLSVKSEKITDQFHPIKVKDLGSLARLTYDPEFPVETNLTLYALPHKKSWVVGYITSLEMDEVYYNFNYVELNSEPIKHFIKYQGNQGKDPEFSNSFDHGYSYLPIIKIKSEHSIFGFSD
jgi:glutaredoxin-related protein